MKILDFAIDVEQAEQDHYFRLADCASNSGIKAIFQMIARKESALLEKLRELKQYPEYREQEIARLPPPQRALQANPSCEILDQQEIHDDLSSYHYILRTERLIYTLYQQLRDSSTDPESRQLLTLLVEEKRQEMGRISTLYDVARVVH